MSELRAARRAWRGRSVTLLFVALTAVPSAAHACATCWGDPDSAVIKGMNGAIFMLLALVGLIYVFMVRVLFDFRRRARRAADHERHFRLIDGGAR